MKTRKSILSLLLAFVMVLSLLPGGAVAVAADGTEGTAIEQQSTASETTLPENTDGAEGDEGTVELTETPTPTETPAVSATPTDAPDDPATATDLTGDPTTAPEQTTDPVETVYTVTFEVNGGSEVEAQQVKDGETANEPEAPAKEGYTFGGWFEDGTCVVAFDFATPITADVKVYAKWTEVKADQPAFNDAKTANGVAVTVSAPEGVFPKGSYLSVESVPVSAQSMVDEAVENERDANANVAVSYTFDIKVLDTEGNEVQPADAQSVKVSFALAEAKDDNLEAQVYHISDEGNAEVLDTSVNDDAVEAVTDGFSFYTVEFTYGTMTYVLPGGSEVKLSDVLSYVGLSGEVTAASGSNDELFSITKESGEWMIHSHQPFNTEEKLSVTINGIVYEIIVTDTNVSGTIYASSLADNDNLVLTGDTTLVMDVNKSLKSISGAYALTIQGSITLEVNNNAGHAISVKSLTSAAFLRLISSKYALNIEQNINTSGGLFIISDGVGAYSKNGSITISGKSTISSGEAAIYAPKGSISVNGDLTAETTNGKYICVVGNNGVTLTGGTVSISSKTIAVRTAGDIELSGNITVSSADSAAVNTLDGGNILIKNGSTIKATGKYGLYAAGGITVEGGTVNAQGSSNAVYSNTGTITIHSPLAITTPDGGRVSGKTIVGADGKTATEVVIQNRPLPGSVSIANGMLAEVGDVLTLDFSSDFPWSGRSVQWQKEVGGGTWEDIPGETNWSYIAKAADQGRAFRVRVTVAGYSGEKFSNPCTILVKPTLGGTVTYSNSGYNSVFGYAYLNDVVSAVTSNMTPSGIPNNRLRFTWQTSADGSTGWTDISGATSSSYKTKAGDHGKYIRVVVSAQGYTGTVNGPALKVRKSAAVAVIAPDLDISGGQVRVKDAQPNQEYLIFSSKQNTIPESAWASAQSPDTVSALYLGGTANSVNYVYTRVKETENSYAGAVASSSIYLGSTTYLQDFYLNVTFMRGGVEYTPEQDEMGRYNIRQGDVLKIDAVPVPSDATDYWGISGQNWLVDNRQTGQSTYGGYFKTASGTYDQIQPSESYKTVYFKPNQLKNGVTLSASLFSSSIGNKYDEIKLNIGTAEGEYLTDNLSVESNITIRKGEILEGFSFSTTPETATTGTMTAQLTDGAGTAPVITFAPENRTFAVNAEGASVGTYKFNVSCQNGTATASLTVTVISDECTVTLSANNGNPAENITQTVKIGSEFILPELPDSFTKPSDFDFGGWDKGAVGEGIHIEGDTVINANWIAHVHKMEFVPGFEPTCVWDGNAEHYHCTVCGKDFDDADGSSEAPTADYYIIPATGHTPGTAVKEKEIDATCTEAGGYDEVVYCTVCHDELSRTHTDISATGHSLTLVPAKSATCTEDGNHAYYECSVCGDWFEDATGTVKITDYLSVIIDALGHDWGEWVQTKAPTTTEEGEETRTCSRCGETETRSIPKLGVTSYEIIVNVGAHGSAHASAGASEEGKTITITATPDSGYEIDKITYTPDGGTATDITSTKSFTMPAAKVTVDVSFKASSVTPPGPITYTVTFKDGESTLSTATVNSGEKVTKPADPTKTGYTFNGWYADATFTAVFDFDQAITANTTVYAKFTKDSDVPPATITYTVTGGADSTWTKGSNATVTITVKRSEADDTCFSHFTGVEIDGVALAAGDYEAVSGSTVVTLKASALQKLSNGSHTVTVKFDDGKASTGLTVKAASGSTDKPTSPKTGDESNMRLWVLLMLMSILGFIATVAVGRKKRQHSR